MLILAQKHMFCGLYGCLHNVVSTLLIYYIRPIYVNKVKNRLEGILIITTNPITTLINFMPISTLY